MVFHDVNCISELQSLNYTTKVQHRVTVNVTVDMKHIQKTLKNVNNFQLDIYSTLSQ